MLLIKEEKPHGFHAVYITPIGASGVIATAAHSAQTNKSTIKLTGAIKND